MNFLRVFLVVLSILVTEPYEFKFQTSAFGKEFRPIYPNNLISSVSHCRSLTKCAMMCSVNDECQTVDFDTVSLRCRLFADWYYEGTTVSSSSTSLIAFIAPKSSFYLLFNQSCLVSSEYSRFLACENGRWACQPDFFWNGSTCERKRSFDQSCRIGQWCNSNRFLFCLNVTARCACNHSMTWNVSKCSPICPAGQMGITFDDLSNDTYNYASPIPNGYAGLQWSNAYLTTAMPNDTGYRTATKSGIYIIFNYPNNPTVIRPIGSKFTLNSLVATAGHIDNLFVDFDGSLAPTGSRWIRYSLNTSNSKLITLNWKNLSRLEIRSPTGGNSNIAIDNICVTL